MATKSVTLKDSNGDTLYPVTDSNVVNINQQKTLAQALDGVVYAEDPTQNATPTAWVTNSDIDWSSIDQRMATSGSSIDYIVLGDLLVCFGKETSNSSPTPKSVTFPKSFAYAPKVFAAPLFQESSNSTWSAWPSTVSTTGASFQCKYVSPDTTAWGSYPFFWLAIGKIATS